MKKIKVVFPVHPRTKDLLKNANKQLKLIKKKYPKSTINKEAQIVLIKTGGKQLYESRFNNFTKKEAYQACKRLKKYKRDCFIRS